MLVLIFLILYSLNAFSLFGLLRSSTLSAEPSKLASVKGRAVIEDGESGEAANQKEAIKVFVANPPAVSVPTPAAGDPGGIGGFKPNLPVP